MQNYTDLDKAAATLKKGGLIIIPTETVYGIAADATNNLAIGRIFEIKNRDTSKPLQLLLKDLYQAQIYAEFDEKSLELAKKHWPGGLTLVLNAKKSANLAENLNKNDETLGLRVPKHQILDELYKKIDFPLACTSANISGLSSCTTFFDAFDAIGDKVDYALDGGNCEVGVSSTVVKIENGVIKILRQGQIIV